MKKVMILGCPGSGKSTFAKKMQKYTGLPLIHLDSIWWKPDKTHILRSEFDRILDSIIREENWILDGDYSRTLTEVNHEIQSNDRRGYGANRP